MATLEDVSLSSESGILPLQCTMLSSEGVMTLLESGRHVFYLLRTGWWVWTTTSYFLGSASRFERWQVTSEGGVLGRQYHALT